MLQQPNNIQPKKKRRLLSTIVILTWLVVLLALVLNRQNIFDWWKLRNYSAPAAIAKIANQDSLTDYARKVFYVNYPNIEPKDKFRAACPNNGGEQTIVLGCYHGGQNGIFLLTVNDRRLYGVTQVTAAHEMLHAAYDRLSSNERTKIDAMLRDYVKNGLRDDRIKGVIAAYKKSEPKDVVNEMHSIFGSEISSLPTNLESYYKRYFKDRSLVTGFAARYQTEFTSRQDAVKRDDARLAVLKNQIDSYEADLKNKDAEIVVAQSDLKRKSEANDIAGYNAGVPHFNQLVNQYNSEIKILQAVIVEYNDLVNERNAIALEESQLLNALSANAQPINN